MDLAKELSDATDTWKININSITEQGIKIARDRANATEECKELHKEYLESKEVGNGIEWYYPDE
jgi:hypothetical protein